MVAATGGCICEQSASTGAFILGDVACCTMLLRSTSLVFGTTAHRSYFWMVLSSTPPVRYRIWPPMVDLPASTCPMNTTFKWSLHIALLR